MKGIEGNRRRGARRGSDKPWIVAGKRGFERYILAQKLFGKRSVGNQKGILRESGGERGEL